LYKYILNIYNIGIYKNVSIIALLKSRLIMFKKVTLYTLIGLIAFIGCWQESLIASEEAYLSAIKKHIQGGAERIGLEDITIPENYGRIIKKFKGESDKIVIQIQDYHAQYDAQLQNYNILRFLTSKNNIELITLEGAGGDFDLSMFQNIENDEVRKHLSLSFVRDGRLSGAEYFAIQNKRFANLQGAEDVTLYLDNVIPFLKSQSFKLDAKKIINHFDRYITLAKEKQFSKEGLRFDKNVMDFYRGSIEFTDFCHMLKGKANLHGIFLENYSNFRLMVDTIEKQRKINFEKVEVEREAIIHNIQQRLETRDQQRMLDKALQYKLGYVSSSVFHAYLLSLCQKNDIGVDEYSDFVAYTAYVKEVEHINTDKLFEELDRVIVQVKDIILSKDIQKDIVDVHHRTRLIEKLYTIKLKNKGLKFIKENPDLFTFEKFKEDFQKIANEIGLAFEMDPAFKALDDYRKTMLTFYQVASKRDEAIVKNINHLFVKFGQNKTVLVCGGFHTDNLTRILERQEISYVIIAPKVVESHAENKYLKRLERSFSSFENYMLNATHALSVLLYGQRNPVDQADISRRINLSLEFLPLALSFNDRLNQNVSAEKFKALAIAPLIHLKDFSDDERTRQIERALEIINISTRSYSAQVENGRYDIYSAGDFIIAVKLIDNKDGSISAEVEFPDLNEPSIKPWLKRGNENEVNDVILAYPELGRSRRIDISQSAAALNLVASGQETKNNKRPKASDRRNDGVAGVTTTVFVPQGVVEVTDLETGESVLVPAGKMLTKGGRLINLEEVDGRYDGVQILADIQTEIAAELKNSESALARVPVFLDKQNYLIRFDVDAFQHLNKAQRPKEIENLLLQMVRLSESRGENFTILLTSYDGKSTVDIKKEFDKVIQRSQDIPIEFKSQIISDREVEDEEFDDAILLSSNKEMIKASGRTRPFLFLEITDELVTDRLSYKWHTITNLTSAIFAARNLSDEKDREQALDQLESMFGKLDGANRLKGIELRRAILILIQDGDKGLENVEFIIENLLIPITRVNPNEMSQMYEMMLEFERSL